MFMANISEIIKECNLALVRKNVLDDLKKTYIYDKSRDFVTRSSNKTIRMTIVNNYATDKHDEFGNKLSGKPAFVIIEFFTVHKHKGSYQLEYTESALTLFLDMIRKENYGEYRNINGKFKWTNIEKIMFYDIGYI